jgi:hypothetical protein
LILRDWFEKAISRNLRGAQDCTYAYRLDLMLGNIDCRGREP